MIKRSIAFYGCCFLLVLSNALAAQMASSGKSDSCEQARAGALQATALAKTPAFEQGVRAVREKVVSAPAQEFIVAFARDSSGSIVLSSLTTGDRSSGTVPDLPNAFADLHNHPKSTPPSSGDLYGLIRKNRKRPGYLLRYVLTPAGDVYVLFIADTTAAAVFLKKFPPQQVAGYSPLFPDQLFAEFRNLKDQQGASEEAAMAYLLEKYNTGVFLLKQEPGGAFRWIRAIASGSGDQLTLSVLDCL